MTAAAVRGVGSGGQQVYGTGSSSQTKETDATGFQELWTKQTQTRETTRDTDSADTAAKTTKQDTAETTKTDTGQDRQGTRVEDKQQTQETQPTDGAETAEKTNEQSEDESWTDEERLEAMEVVASAAQTLVTQIAETFDMTEEQVQGMMEDMGLETDDLLDPQNLSSLILQAGGAENSVDLLTNESLYTNYQTLMAQGRELFEQSAQELGMTAEELADAVAQTSAEAADVTEAAFQQTAETIASAAEADPVVETESTIETVTDATDENDITEQTTDAVTGTAETQQSAETEAEAGTETGAESMESDDAEEQTPVNQTVNTNNASQRFDQTVQAESAADVQEAAGAWDVDTQDMMRQIMDYMKVQVKPGFSHLEMQLHPENLGTLQVQVASKGGVVTANFVTENEAVKAALESQMVQLQASFEEQGVRVDAVEVSVQAHLFQQDLDRRDEASSEQTGERRPRTRRLRLDELGNAEDLEALTEEEQLAARVMDMNGQTVDYTA